MNHGVEEMGAGGQGGGGWRGEVGIRVLRPGTWSVIGVTARGRSRKGSRCTVPITELHGRCTQLSEEKNRAYVCLCVSVCRGSWGGVEVVFYSGFSREENRSSRETGPRPKEAAVPCMNARSHPARYSTLSTPFLHCWSAAREFYEGRGE